MIMITLVASITTFIAAVLYILRTRNFHDQADHITVQLQRSERVRINGKVVYGTNDTNNLDTRSVRHRDIGSDYKPKRMLIVGMGLPIGGPRAWIAMRNTLLEQYGNSDFVAAFISKPGHEETMNAEVLYEWAKYVWTIPKSNGYSYIVDSISHRCSKNERIPSKHHRDTVNLHWRNLCSLPIQLGNWGCPLSKSSDTSNPSTDILSIDELLILRHVVSEKMKAFKLHRRYDLFMVTRSDMFHTCHHFKLAGLGLHDSQLYIPYLGDQNNQLAGLSVNHFVGTRKPFMAALSVTEELICHANLWSSLMKETSRIYHTIISFESLLYRVYAIQEIIVEVAIPSPFHDVSRLIVINNDTCSTQSTIQNNNNSNNRLSSIGIKNMRMHSNRSHFHQKRTFAQSPVMKPKPKKLLIIGIGLPRGGKWAWASMKKHLLHRFKGADFALAFTAPVDDNQWHNTSTNKELFQLVRYVWTLPEDPIHGFEDIIANISTSCSVGESQSKFVRNDWKSLCDLGGPAFLDAGRRGGDVALKGFGCQYSTHTSSSPSALLILRHFIAQKIRSLHLEDKYELFMLTRTDYFYLCDHFDVSFLSFDASTVYVSLGEEYGGVTDRHLVASSDAFLKAMSITEQLICHADFWMKHAFSPELNDHFSFETLFYRTYVILGLIVKQFDLTMFTVRAPGDTTSLSKGEKYDLFETRFGFLVKYPTELIAAIGYCGVLNLTEHISHMRLE